MTGLGVLAMCFMALSNVFMFLSWRQMERSMRLYRTAADEWRAIAEKVNGGPFVVGDA